MEESGKQKQRWNEKMTQREKIVEKKKIQAKLLIWEDKKDRKRR